jgi:hypothetical protein
LAEANGPEYAPPNELELREPSRYDSIASVMHAFDFDPKTRCLFYRMHP